MQRLFVGAVAAVTVRMIFMDKLGIAFADGAAVGVGGEPQGFERLSIRIAQHMAIAGRGRFAVGGIARAYGVQRIGKIGPTRPRIGAVRGKGAGFALPPRIRGLRGINLVASHAGKIVEARVKRADMVEAQPAPRGRRTIFGQAIKRRCAKLSGFGAAFDRASARAVADPAMKS